jgi:hypothetical protein
MTASQVLRGALVRFPFHGGHSAAMTTSRVSHGSLFHFLLDVKLPGELPALVVLPVAILLVLSLTAPLDALHHFPVLPVYLLYFGFDVVSSFFLLLLYSHLLGLPVSFSPHEHASLFFYSVLIFWPLSADPPVLVFLSTFYSSLLFPLP